MAGTRVSIIIYHEKFLQNSLPKSAAKQKFFGNQHRRACRGYGGCYIAFVMDTERGKL